MVYTGAAKEPTFDHVGVIVKDIDKTYQFLSSIGFDVSFDVFDYAMGGDIILAGEPFKLRIATGKLWSVGLELLQPLDTNSFFAKYLKTNGEGIHHVAYTTSNWDKIVESLVKNGGKMVVGGRDEVKEEGGKMVVIPSISGMRWCYLDTKPGGIVIELIETT